MSDLDLPKYTFQIEAREITDLNERLSFLLSELKSLEHLKVPPSEYEKQMIARGFRVTKLNPSNEYEYIEDEIKRTKDLLLLKNHIDKAFETDNPKKELYNYKKDLERRNIKFEFEYFAFDSIFQFIDEAIERIKHFEQTQLQYKPKNLSPNLSLKQIRKLSEALADIFEATPKQWQALFSETEIQLSEPIKAFAVSDIGILLYHLKERNLIEATKYPSIIERTKAFSINDIPIKAKQITDLKQNGNFPIIGKNHSKISKAVASL